MGNYSSPRAKHKENTVYTEDPIFNNRDYHFDWERFGKTMKRLRLEAQLTQDDLAAITGISSSMISQFENAYQSKQQSTPKHPNQDQLVCILHALKVDANALFESNLTMPTMSERDQAVEELVNEFRLMLKQSDFYTHYDESQASASKKRDPQEKLYFKAWQEKAVAERKPRQ